jgi:hypothetical protein
MAALRNQNARRNRPPRLFGQLLGYRRRRLDVRQWAASPRRLPSLRGAASRRQQSEVHRPSDQCMRHGSRSCGATAAHRSHRCSPTSRNRCAEVPVSAADWPSRPDHRACRHRCGNLARPRPTAKRRRGHPDAHDAAVRVNSTIVVGWLVTGFEVGAKQQHESRDHHRGRHSAFQKAPLSRAKALESPPSRRDQAGFFRQG